MKQLIIGLAAAGLLCTAGVAQAAAGVTGTNLRIDNLYSDGNVRMELLSDTGSTMSLSLTDVMPEGFYGRGVDGWGEDGNGSTYSTSLQFDVRDGYRVTALTISGKAYGVLETADAPADIAQQMYARNAFDFTWHVNGAAPFNHVAGTNILGNQTFGGTAAQVIQGRSVVDFHAALSAEVRGATDVRCTDHCWEVDYPAFAGIEISDVVMTVQISPVPEPATYAMLLGGLALTGVVARRRKA